jgi:uncharacterized SAM-binding protein YcdF (DUF218 family)
MHRIAIFVALLAALATAGWYFFWPREARLPLPPDAPRVQPAEPVPQGPRFPAPVAADEAKPLPTLRESDATLVDALAGIAGADKVARFLVPEGIVRGVVATIDNLPRASYAARLNPIRPLEGLVKTQGEGDTLAIAPDNASRYVPAVRAFEGLDSKRLVALYARLYPLFQQAYVELGYPNGYFNDRLIEVIDHLLQAPDLRGSPKLAVPHVLYEYADPQLESRSSGQKVLMRMGADNEARVKAKLRELRGELLAQAPKR